jgi:hypothetical protein
VLIVLALSNCPDPARSEYALPRISLPEISLMLSQKAHTASIDRLRAEAIYRRIQPQNTRPGAGLRTSSAMALYELEQPELPKSSRRSASHFSRRRHVSAELHRNMLDLAAACPQSNRNDRGKNDSALHSLFSCWM